VSNKKENISVNLFTDDIHILLDTLNFAQKASAILAHEEIKKGGGPVAAQKMQLITENCITLYKIFYTHLSMGEPDHDHSH
jgi:hypothetical protein